MAPTGGRLYVGALEGIGGDGIDVLETGALRRVATWLPGEAVYCLAASPDGARLYASIRQSLVTLDARTGQQLARVDVESGSVNVLPLALALKGPTRRARPVRPVGWHKLCRSEGYANARAEACAAGAGSTGSESERATPHPKHTCRASDRTARIVVVAGSRGHPRAHLGERDPLGRGSTEG